MKAFIFPGQGSQAKGMGGELFDRFPEVTAKANKLLGYSIKELCLDDPDRQLNKTQFTQPALYVVNALTYYQSIEDGAEAPDFLAGHSLGEFSALMAAECYDFEAGLKLVKKRGELMSQESGGAMAALKNASYDQVLSVLKDNDLESIDIANLNSRSQIVISGKQADIIKSEAFFLKAGMAFYPLNTSGAFHSRYMKDSQEKFERYIKKFKFSEPRIPVISNVSGRPYEEGGLLDGISNQLSNPVQWYQTIEYLEAEGVKDFYEIGHGEVLTKILVDILPSTATADSTAPEAPREIQQEASTQHASVTSETSITKSADSAVETKVTQWNKRHPVGSPVKAKALDDDSVVKTRSEAIVLFGHRAAVYLEGFNGYFDIDEIQAV